MARRLLWPVAVGGGTHAGAITVAERLVAQGAQALVSFGLAGGLVPELRPGELLVPHMVYAGGECFPTDPHVSQLLGGISPHTLYGAEAAVVTSEAKRDAHARTAAAAVDLESGAVARVAMAHRLPFAVLRAVCDSAERDLPPAALVALDSQGGISILRVLHSVIAEPRQLPALIKLAADAGLARRALTARVMQIARTAPQRRR